MQDCTSQMKHEGIFNDASQENKVTHNCDICGYAAENFWTVSFSKNPQFFCKICKKYIGKKNKFTKHIEIHGDAIRKCPRCREEFVNKDVLSFETNIQRPNNVNAVNKEFPYKCDVCDCKYDHFWLLTAHKATHNFCRTCKKYTNNRHDHKPRNVFPDKESLKPQIKQHPRPIQVCHVCGKEYPRVQLKTHNLQSQPRQFYKCNGCGSTLRLQDSTATDVQRKFKCVPCNKVFVMKLAFLRRQGTLYKCRICEARFSNGNLLKRHLAVHRIEKEVKCGICSEVLNNEYQFHMHKKSHHTEEIEVVGNTVCVEKDIQDEIKCEETIITNLEEAHQAPSDSQQFDHINIVSNSSVKETEELFKTEPCDEEFSVLRTTLEGQKTNCKEERCHSSNDQICGNEEESLNASIDKEYICDNCHKKFSNNNLFTIHRKICNKLQNEQVFVCQNCSR